MKRLLFTTTLGLLLWGCNSSKSDEKQEIIAENPVEIEDPQTEEALEEPISDPEISENTAAENTETETQIKEDAEPPKISYRGASPGEGEKLFKMAERYEFGDGVKKDLSRAIELYRQSAELDYAKAQYSLAFLIKDNKESLKWLTKSAEQGHSEAQYELGIQYLYGYGVDPNIRESTSWFQKAADNGHKIAQYKLGLMYDVGEGVKQDLFKAANLYEKSAKQGVGIAQFNLAMMYITGEGVDSVNMYEAAHWMDKAKIAGIKDAKKAWSKFGLENYQ